MEHVTSVEVWEGLEVGKLKTESEGEENPLEEGDEKLKSMFSHLDEREVGLCRPELAVLLPYSPNRLGLLPYKDGWYFCDPCLIRGGLARLVNLLLGCPKLADWLSCSADLLCCFHPVLKLPLPEDELVLVVVCPENDPVLMVY